MDIYSPIETSNILLRKAIYEAHEGRCFYTGQFIRLDDLAIDHIFPKASGGKDCIANYAPTTNRLNLAKSDKVDFCLVERMKYINIVVFAPKVLSLILESVSIEHSKELCLRDFLKCKGIQMDIVRQGNLTNALRKRIFFRYGVLTGETRKRVMFRTSELECVYQSEPALFRA